jgi:hypothetical protein
VAVLWRDNLDERSAVTIRLYMKAARVPPRTESANNHDLCPGAMPRNARSAALSVRQIPPRRP